MTEDALFAGVALSEEGRAYSGMGANLGDFDNDGYLDIVITNFQDQTNSLYHNAQGGFFTEMSFAKGSVRGVFPIWHGVSISSDFNNDGWLDLFVAMVTLMTISRRSIRLVRMHSRINFF